MNNLRNHVVLIGRLGKEAEIKNLSNGNQVANVSIATNENYKKNDEWVTTTQWHNLVAWGKLAERLAKIKKGTQVAVQGKLTYNTYEDKDGNKRTQTQVIVNELMITERRTANA